MSRTVHSLKLVSHSASKLDTLTYELGDVVFDETNKTLRVMDSETFGGHTVATRAWTLDQMSTGFVTPTSLSTTLQSYVTSTNLTNVLTNYALSNSLQPVATSGLYSDLTGKPDLTVYATYTDLSTAINNLINGAPGALNTLNELSAALGNDASFASSITSLIGAKAPINNPTFTGTVSGVTATMVGLGNVTNESKATMFSNPTFTNSVQVNGEVSINNNDIGILALGPHGIKFENTADVPNMKFGFVVKGFGGSTLLNYHPDTNFQFNSDVNFVKVGLSQTPVVQITGGGVSTNPGLIVNGTTVLQQTTEVMNTKSGATGTVTHDFLTGGIWYHNSISANFTANFTNVPTTDNRSIVCTLILSQSNPAYIPNAVQIDGSPQTIKWLGGSAPSGNASKVDIVSFTLIRVLAGWTVLGSLSTYG